MSIVEITRTYNLMSILKESIEISEFNFERNKIDRISPTENMVTFMFGRQCGHTSTIIELMNSNLDMKWNTLVVVPNHSMTKNYNRKGVDNVIPISIRSALRSGALGNRLIGKNDQPIGFIFDSCTPENIREFFKENFVYLNGMAGIKFVVNVAPII